MSNRKQIIAEHSQFHRENYGKLLNFAFSLAALIFCLLGYILYAYLTRPPIEYFATTSSGQVVKISPLKD